jgi:hypothetical protein
MSDTLPPELRNLLTQIDGRLGRIETDISELRGMRRDTEGLRVDVATINGRLAGMPTTLQTVGITWSVLIGLPTIAALAAFALKTMGYLP